MYKLKKKNTISFLHKAALSPVTKTRRKATDAGFFATWPGLTSELVGKYLNKSEATAK